MTATDMELTQLTETGRTRFHSLSVTVADLIWICDQLGLDPRNVAVERDGRLLEVRIIKETRSNG